MTLHQLEYLSKQWCYQARHSQLPPAHKPWRFWGNITGRGTGKTRILSEFAHDKAALFPGKPGFLAAETLGDVRKTLINGDGSGLIDTMRPENPCEVRKIDQVETLVWENGAYAHLCSSEIPSTRGGNYWWGIGDEIATWKRQEDRAGNSLWVNLGFALRAGKHPQAAWATTPRPVEIVKDLIEDAEDPDSDVVVSGGSMLDNVDNIADSFVSGQLRRFMGTRTEKQEIEGLLLLDTENAIVLHDDLNADRVDLEDVPELTRVVIGCDPAMKDRKSSDRTGILVVGLGVDGHAYILEDLTCKMSPDGWRRRLADAYWQHNADMVIPEDNNGGDLIGLVLRDHDARVQVKATWSHESKHKRFAHICGYFEKHEVHIVGKMPELEDQIVQFTPAGYMGDDSPDNADAMVFGLTELLLNNIVTDWDAVIAANTH